MAPDELLDEYANRLSTRINPVLSQYAATIPGAPPKGPRRVGKEVNDPLWGTISLHAAEVAVVDSPVHQRLRQIRQLGVAHYLYPSANHTRFEHSLGACFQITRLAESINTHAREQLLDDETVRLLRLAALCHDLGHGFMSHVSDNAVRADPPVKRLLSEFRSRHGVAVQLSEVAAYLIVTSDGFKNLLSAARAFEGGLPGDEGLPTRVASLIIGRSPIPEQPFIHELISGPFDADKLDYLPRDAKFCGVPVPTDVGRLIQKLRAVRLRVAEVDEELRRADPEEVEHAVYVGIAPSGASALDEVSIGRSLMFDKVYRHHKVRAAEAMVAAVIDQVEDVIAESRAEVPLALSDEEFLNLTTWDLEHMSAKRGVVVDEMLQLRFSIGLDILRRLRHRQMFVRAYAFSQHLPEEAQTENPTRKNIEKMMRDLYGHPSIRKAFVTDLADKVAEILRLLHVDVEDLPAGADLAAYICIDPADATRSGETGDYDGESAYLIDDDGTLRRVARVHAQSRGWSEAYIQTHDIGYVFTTKSLAPYVYIAAVSVAFRTWKVVTPSAALRHSKQDSTRIRQIQLELAKTGFYSDLPYSLRPTPSVLTRHDAERRIEAARSALQGYQGMLDSRNLMDVTPTAQKIRDWVSQFGEEHADAALLAIQHLKMLDARLAAAAFKAFIASPEGLAFRGSSVCPIGDPKDGSSAVAGAVRQIAAEFGCTVRGDAEALRNDEPIIYVDDFIGRGSSTISIMSSLLGVVDTEGLDESRERELPDTLKEKLRQRKLAFLYIAGMRWRHENDFLGKLSRLGIDDAIEFVHLEQDQLPTLDSIGARSSDPKRWSAFVEHCRRVGLQLTAGSPKSEERALGYGNAGLMVCTTFNTPTAALTCLWKEGVSDGWQWTPLLPRFKKT